MSPTEHRDKPCHRREGAARYERTLRREHADDCTDVRECTGCAPCPKRHCVLCAREHLVAELQTCPYCIARMRSEMKHIEDLTALLPDQATEGGSEGHLVAAAPMPGGDAQVLMAPGSYGSQADTHDHESWADPVPPLLLLASWEDDWRHVRGDDAAGQATIAGCRTYLNDHLDWAAQHHGAVDEFARDLTRCRQRLEATLHASAAAATKAVPCPTCGTMLDREYRAPRPCRCWRRAQAMAAAEPAQVIYRRLILSFPEDHEGCDSGGLDDPHHLAGWRCPRCRRDYSPTEYMRAMQAAVSVVELRTAYYLADELQLQPATLRQWANRGHVRPHGRDAQGRVLYEADEVRRHAEQAGPATHAG